MRLHPAPRATAALLLAVAGAPALFAPHLDYRGVVSYSESEKVQRYRDAGGYNWGSGSTSSLARSTAFSGPSVSLPDWDKIHADMAWLAQQRAAQERAERDRAAAAERERQARIAQARAILDPLEKHMAASAAGEERTIVADAIEYLTGKPAWPEKPAHVVNKNPKMASHVLTRITKGPNAHWAPVWTSALMAIHGERHSGGIERLNRALLEQHPDVALNLALASLLDAGAATYIHPTNYEPLAPEFRRLAAGALHALATPPAAGERPRPVLSRAVAALAVRAQRGAPGLPLSMAAAQLVERTLRAPGATGLDEYWTTFLSGAKAEPVAEPVTTAPDFEGVAYIARVITPELEWHLNAIADLRPADVAQRPRWLDDPAVGGLFRRLVEWALSSKGTAAYRRAPVRQGLQQLFVPMTANEAARFNLWLAHARDFDEAPAAQQRDLAPQILLEALDGSPEANFLLPKAKLLLAKTTLPGASDRAGDEVEVHYRLAIARPYVPGPVAWPALDTLARNHLPRLDSPRLRLAVAQGLIQAAGGRALTAPEKGLLNNLLGPRPAAEFAPEERIQRMEAMMFLDGGENAVAAATLNTLHTNPKDPALPHLLGFALSLRVQRLQLNAEPTVAEIDEALALADQLHRVSENMKNLETSRIDPGVAVAWLLELRRRIGGVSAPGPRDEKIAFHLGRFRALNRGPLTNAWDSVYELAALVGEERKETFADRAALDALGLGLMLAKVEREVPGLPTSAWADPWWVQSLALRNKSLTHTRLAVRATSERLAGSLMTWRFNDKPTQFRERARADSEVRVILFKRGDAEPLPWHLLGRDLALGGLATRALLLAPTLPDPLKSNDAAIKAWLERIAELPLALPPAAVIDQLAVRALDEKFSAADRLNAALGLAAATEPVLRDAADTAGSLAWRKHALTLMARHADRLPLPSEELQEAGLMFEEIARLAGPRLLRLRVAWELTKIDAPEKSPVERAAAVLKGDPEAAELASYAAFVFATELPPKIALAEKFERHLMFDPDPSLAPALLRATESPAQQEKLISAYLAGQRPKTTEHWLALLDRRAWQ